MFACEGQGKGANCRQLTLPYTPPNPTLPTDLLYMTMGKPKEPVWGHFKVLEQSKTGQCKVVCLHSDHEFLGGASRMSHHFLGNNKVTGGVQLCEPKNDDEKQRVAKLVKQLRQLEDKAQAKQ